MGKCGLAQSRRSGKEDMVQGFAPFLCGLKGDLQALLDLHLPDKLFQPVRPYGGVVALFRQRVW